MLKYFDLDIPKEKYGDNKFIMHIEFPRIETEFNSEEEKEKYYRVKIAYLIGQIKCWKEFCINRTFCEIEDYLTSNECRYHEIYKELMGIYEEYKLVKAIENLVQ